MMAKRKVRRLLSALDLGSSKVTVVVAEVGAEDELKVLALGVAPCKGVRRGELIRPELVRTAMMQAVQSAEVMLGERISGVVISTTGEHVHAFNAQGMVTIEGPTITAADVERVIAETKSLNIGVGQDLLHVLPQLFIVDESSQVKDPVGLPAKRLDAYVHVVTGSTTISQTIKSCVESQGLQVTDVVLSPLASGLAVLTQDEKELGVCLIDLGSGNTDVAVFAKGALSFSASLPIGGDHISHDIAHVLGSSMQVAESVKIQQGVAYKAMVAPQDSVEVKTSVGAPAQHLSLAILAEVIEARMEEIFNLVMDKITEEGLNEYLGAGVVLTGGGAKLPGCLECAADVFQKPVRLGLPQYIKGLNESIYDPAHSTSIGLLMYAKLQQEGHPVQRRRCALRCAWWGPLKNWLKQFF